MDSKTVSEKTIKTAMCLDLPAKKGDKVIFTQTDGEKAKSMIRKIVRIIYGKTSRCMFVTFETKNSVYENVPFTVKDSVNYYDGWYIEKGVTVSTSQESFIINEIEEITENQIIVIDTLGRKFKLRIEAVVQ